MNRSVVNAVSVIGKMGGAEWHFTDDKKRGKAVTGLESRNDEYPWAEVGISRRWMRFNVSLSMRHDYIWGN